MHPPPPDPLEAYAFDARLGKRSVFILDPRLYFAKFDKKDIRIIHPS